MTALLTLLKSSKRLWLWRSLRSLRSTIGATALTAVGCAHMAAIAGGFEALAVIASATQASPAIQSLSAHHACAPFSRAVIVPLPKSSAARFLESEVGCDE